LSGEGLSNCPSFGEETEALLGSRPVKKAKEGFFMAQLLSNCSSRGTSSFQKVVRSFLAGTGLPFAEVLSAERIERVFRKHRCDFGQRGIYSAAMMLWSFLSQVLRDGKEAACQAGRGKGVRNRFLILDERFVTLGAWEEQNVRLMVA
jgi:hypothetical protein